MKILKKFLSESDSFGFTAVFYIEFSVKKSRFLNELLSRGFCLTEDQVPDQEFYFFPSVHSSICPSTLSISPFVRLLFPSWPFVLVCLLLKFNLLCLCVSSNFKFFLFFFFLFLLKLLFYCCLSVFFIQFPFVLYLSVC